MEVSTTCEQGTLLGRGAVAKFIKNSRQAAKEGRLSASSLKHNVNWANNAYGKKFKASSTTALGTSYKRTA